MLDGIGDSGNSNLRIGRDVFLQRNRRLLRRYVRGWSLVTRISRRSAVRDQGPVVGDQGGLAYIWAVHNSRAEDRGQRTEGEYRISNKE